MKTFAENLKALRTKNSLTQDALADVLDVTSTAVRQWEKGNCEPTLSKFMKLAKYFDVTLGQLAGTEEL